ncbi:MAG: flippase [Deltaproteobacteria bacterium]|nr:flippase [Deltaproteobacteria bacterium]
MSPAEGSVAERTPAEVAPPPAEDAGAADVRVAVRSALVLNVALVATWAVASLARFFLSRHLGPTLFGVYRAADAQTTLWFMLLSFGLETYIQKEIPVRPQHATDFLGGVVVVRALLTVAVLAGLGALLWLRGVSGERSALLLTFCAGYAFMAMNHSLAALLHAARRVGGLAVMNVATKAIWGVGILFAVLSRLPLAGIAGAMALSEIVRCAVLALLVRKHLGTMWRVDLAAVRRVFATSLPFYLNGVAITVYGNVDTIVLSWLSSDAEVGYYGAAQNIAGLSMFISPLIGWVLMPLLSRAGARSPDEMYGLFRRALELVVTLIAPVVALVALGAELWVTRLSGGDYGPAAVALRILAPMFVLTYLATISATTLNLLDRSWTVTLVSMGSLVASTVLDVLLVPRAWRAFGVGGAGTAAALSLTLTEAAVTASFLFVLGRRAFDRRNLAAVGKSVLICAVVAGLDHLLRPMAWARLMLDGIAFVALALLTGTVRVNEVRALVGDQLRAKLTRRAAPAGG